MTAATLVLVLAYFIPSMVAVGRHVRNVGSVVVINVLLGWTLVGWVVALAMAAGSVSRGAPRGMEAVTCPRCNAEQNVPAGAASFDCWQCHYQAQLGAPRGLMTQLLDRITEPANELPQGQRRLAR